MISTGVTLLDLALTDSIDFGFSSGRIYNIVGDSSSGKSLLALTTLAKAFYETDYKVFYNDVEAALGFNLSGLFGEDFAKNLELVQSDTIQDFYQDILIRIDSGEKFVYVLDSLDALTSVEEIGIGDEIKKSGVMKGSYGLQKAKLMSQILRHVNLKLKETESILIIISQTRDNLNALSFEKKTRAGGRALEFYCTGVMWLTRVKRIKKKDIDIGILSEVKISKNKITGKLRKVQFPIYYDYGIDDIGGMVDFLVKMGKIKTKKLTLFLEELGISGTRKNFISEIEKKGLFDDLRKITKLVWDERELEIKTNRRPRFGQKIGLDRQKAQNENNQEG